MEPGSSPTGDAAGHVPAVVAGTGKRLEIGVIVQDTGWRRLLPEAESLARRAARAVLLGERPSTGRSPAAPSPYCSPTTARSGASTRSTAARTSRPMC